MYILCDSAVQLLGIYPREEKINVHSSVIHNGQKLEIIQASFYSWADKQTVL